MNIKAFLHKIIKYRKYKKFNNLKKELGIDYTIDIQPDIVIGDSKNFKIEKYVYIGPNAKIQALGGVTIKRGVIIGPDLRIYSANHRFRDATSIPYDKTYIKKHVTIEENVWIGGGVTIVPGTFIGEGSIIGAGTVVSGNIPKLSIVIGNPCKVISKRDEQHYYKLKEQDRIYLKLKKKHAESIDNK